MKLSRSSRRAFLASSAAGVAGAFLAACGATPAPAATTASETQATQAPAAVATATTAPPATEGNIEIRWLDWSDQDDIINAAIARLKETHPNVTVNFVAIGDQWGEKQLTQMVSGNAPDLLTGNDETSYKWAEKGQLLDLNPLVERDLTAEQIADFFEYQWNGLIYPGDQTRMGLPYYTWVYQYYYNADALGEAGLDVPVAGWTLDDYSTYLEKLVVKDASGKITRWGGMDGSYDAFRFAIWAHIFGGNIVNPKDWTECVANSDATKAAFEWHRERLWDTNTLIQTQQAGQYANLDLLATGKIAMQGEGNGAEGTFFTNPPSIKWGCVAPPVGPTGVAQGIGTVDNWGVWKGTKAPDVVWDLLKIVSLEDEFEKGFSTIWVATPNRKSLLPGFKESVQAKYPDATDEQIDPQLDLLNSGSVTIGEQFKKHKASTEILIPVMEKILRVGDGSVDLLDAAAAEITALNREA
ncbi:MAG: ABC transporter substrate-binding protein [Anaerolineae bacterium]